MMMGTMTLKELDFALNPMASLATFWAFPLDWEEPRVWACFSLHNTCVYIELCKSEL